MSAQSCFNLMSLRGLSFAPLYTSAAFFTLRLGLSGIFLHVQNMVASQGPKVTNSQSQ